MIKSPFPGMDPYLEARWSDVHVRLIGYISEALQPLLPTDLRARAEERVLLDELNEEDDARRVVTYQSDVALVEAGRRPGSPGPEPASGTGTAGRTEIEPVLIDLEPVIPIERWVQIIDVRSGNRVVTVIEVLSPGNKQAGRLNRDYRRKLEDYVKGGVNVVEIDLLRSSRGRLEVGQADLPIDRRAPYLVCLRRAQRPGRWEVYPLPVRQRLPRVPVPLRRHEPDVLLDLQPLIERVYVAGGHDDIDYSKPPEPPLEGEDAPWADQLLRSAGGR